MGSTSSPWKSKALWKKSHQKIFIGRWSASHQRCNPRKKMRSKFFKNFENFHWKLYENEKFWDRKISKFLMYVWCDADHRLINIFWWDFFKSALDFQGGHAEHGIGMPPCLFRYDNSKCVSWNNLWSYIYTKREIYKYELQNPTHMMTLFKGRS